MDTALLDSIVRSLSSDVREGRDKAARICPRFALLLSLSSTLFAQSLSFTEYPLPEANSLPQAITAGPDGALWFTALAGGTGRITTAGTISEHQGGLGIGITAGPDGALWFTGYGIGRITTAGTITSYPVDTSNGRPYGIGAS